MKTFPFSLSFEGSFPSGPFSFLHQGPNVLAPNEEEEHGPAEGVRVLVCGWNIHVPDPSLPDTHGGGSAKVQGDRGQMGEGRWQAVEPTTL